MALGDEIQIRITGDVAALTAAAKTGAADLGVLETAATKTGAAMKDAGNKVDSVANEIATDLRKIETESRNAGTALTVIGNGSTLPALAAPLDAGAASAKNLAQGFQLAGWQAQQLTFQLHDVVTGLISGQRPMTVMMQQGLQISQMFGPGASLGGVMSGIGASALEMINPLNMAVIGFGAVATGISAVWSTWGSGSDKTKEDLKQHAALIDQIKTEWGSAGAAVSAYVIRSGNVIQAKIAEDIDRQKKELADFAKQLSSTADEMVRAKEAISGPAAVTANFIPSSAPAGLAELRAAVDALSVSANSGKPDVAAFQDEVAKIAKDADAPKEVVDLANALSAAAQSAVDAQSRLVQANAAEKLVGDQAEKSAQQVALLNAALSQMRQLAAPQLDARAQIDAAEKLGLAGASNREERDDVEAMANAARKNLIYDETTKTIQQMDVAMQAAGKTEAEIARANLDTWQKAQDAAKGVAGIEGKVDDAAARAKLAVINQTEREAQAAAQQRIALTEAQEISSIDKMKAKRQELANLQGSLTGDRAQANAKEMEILDAQIASAGVRMTLDAEKAKIAATKAGSAERIAAQKEYFDKVKAQYGAESAEAIAAQRELNAAMVPRSGGGGAGAANAELAAQRRIQQDKLRETEYELDAEVRAGRISEAQKIATLRDLTQQSYAEALKRLDAEEATLAQGSAAWKRIELEKLTVKQQMATAMAKLDDDAARASERAARQSQQAWQQAIDPMVSSFTGGLRSMMTGQETFKDAALSTIGDILMAEIEADAKAFLYHALYGALGLKEDQKNAQGGLLWMLFSQTQKTAASVAGAGARTAIETGETTAAVTAKATEVASHGLGEATKTAATAAGAASRTAVNASAAAGAKAVEATTMQGSIMSHAASAAAATFDSVAQIPLIGYLLAPAAAAASFAAVALFGGLLSFDVGAWNLPNDTVAKVHKGEMIVPANFSDGLRSALTGGGAAGAGGGAGGGPTAVHFHVNAMDGASVKAFFKQHGRTIAQTVAGVQNQNPSLRGNT